MYVGAYVRLYVRVYVYVPSGMRYTMCVHNIYIYIYIYIYHLREMRQLHEIYSICMYVCVYVCIHNTFAKSGQTVIHLTASASAAKP